MISFLLFINLTVKAQENVTPNPPQEGEFKVCSSCSSSFNTQEKVIFNDSSLDTRSVLIYQNDEIVYERYSDVTSAQKPHRLWSMSKSISSLLIGVRIQEGKLKLSDTLTKFYPQVSPSPHKSQITIENLLSMESGIDFQEVYEENPFKSDVIRMLYLKENKDMANYVVGLEQKYPPGTHFYYSSGETNLLMGCLKKTFSSVEEYQNYPWDQLFGPLNITSAHWEADESGTFVGSSYIFMTPRDLLKIGKLVLDRGKIKDKQLVSEEYLTRSFIPSSASCKTKLESPTSAHSYGYSWWLNAPCQERPQYKKAMKKLPDNLILALGHHGQTMAIFPDLKAVAIRFGADKKGHLNRELWLEEVYENLKMNNKKEQTL